MRHKDFVKVLKDGALYRGRYDPQTKEKNNFVKKVLVQVPNDLGLITGPLYVQLFYGMKRPKSHYGTGRNSGKLKASAPKYPDKKPDIDNFEKFVFDCLSGVVYRDDAQIVSCLHDKRYSENPRVEIEIRKVI